MRFRFSIRDLLLLTLVVALAVGWWLDHHELMDQKRIIVYPVKTTSASFALKMLNAAVGGSEVLLTADERNNSIVAAGKPVEQVKIRDLISQIEAIPGKPQLQVRPSNPAGSNGSND